MEKNGKNLWISFTDGMMMKEIFIDKVQNP